MASRAEDEDVGLVVVDDQEKKSSGPSWSTATQAARRAFSTWRPHVEPERSRTRSRLTGESRFSLWPRRRVSST